MPSRAFDSISRELDRFEGDQASPKFRAALRGLEIVADGGDLDACEALAEILATSPVHKNAAAAYKWYYIVLSQHGYTVAFHDLNGTPPSYRGQVGDFRNEAQVSPLVEELGFDRVRELDAEVREWLTQRHLTFVGADRER